MAGIYDVVVNLVFTSPDLQESSTSGKGLFASFFGLITAGVFNWDSSFSDVTFDQGSTIAVAVEDGMTFGHRSTVKTDLALQSVDLVPMNAPSPAPLPAALPAILLALGAMVFVGRRQRAVSA